MASVDQAASDLETCPRCGAGFSARANRAHPNAIAEIFTPKWVTTKITDSALVACPACQHRFPSDHVRFFGLLSLRQVRLMFAVYVAGLAVLAIGLGLATR